MVTQALQFFVNAFRQIIGLLNNTTFELYGQNVSLGAVLMVFIALGAIISVFWKGAKG